MAESYRENDGQFSFLLSLAGAKALARGVVDAMVVQHIALGCSNIRRSLRVPMCTFDVVPGCAPIRTVKCYLQRVCLI